MIYLGRPRPLHGAEELIYSILGATRAAYSFLGIADPQELLESMESTGCRLALRALVSGDPESARLRLLLRALERWAPQALKVEVEHAFEPRGLLPTLLVEAPEPLAGRLVFHGVPGYATLPALLQAALEACRAPLRVERCPSAPAHLELYVAEGKPSYESLLTAARAVAACQTLYVKVIHASLLEARGESSPSALPCWALSGELLAGVLGLEELLARLGLALSSKLVEQL